MTYQDDEVRRVLRDVITSKAILQESDRAMVQAAHDAVCHLGAQCMAPADTAPDDSELMNEDDL